MFRPLANAGRVVASLITVSSLFQSCIVRRKNEFICFFCFWMLETFEVLQILCLYFVIKNCHFKMTHFKMTNQRYVCHRFVAFSMGGWLRMWCIQTCLYEIYTVIIVYRMKILQLAMQISGMNFSFWGYVAWWKYKESICLGCDMICLQMQNYSLKKLKFMGYQNVYIRTDKYKGHS